MPKFKYAGLQQAIFNGDEKTAITETEAALAEGQAPLEIINQGLIPGVHLVSEAFTRSEIFIPEMLLSAMAMKDSLAIIKPLLSVEEMQGLGTIVIGTVLGDVHDIGKNLAAWLLEGAGFRVVDLGVDVPPEQFIEAIKEEQPSIVALSSLLTTSAHQMKVIVNYLEQENLRSQVKILIGGAAVTQDFADEIGADGYALDASAGVQRAKQILGIAY
jgi:5-methyltetrahydrofolate--homocysteine methyltransferase